MTAKVSFGFARMPDVELDNFAQGVIDALTGNATYPTPPVTLAALQTATDDFTAKIAAAQSGGPPATAAKNNSRVALVDDLRQVANYVQIECDNNPAQLLSSGFQLQSDNRSRTSLAKPQGLVIKNRSSGQLTAAVKPVKNTRTYEGRTKGPTGDWLPSVFSSDSQQIIFIGLTPGLVYTIQVRAIGGTTGQSDWSDPSSHMCM